MRIFKKVLDIYIYDSIDDNLIETNEQDIENNVADKWFHAEPFFVQHPKSRFEFLELEIGCLHFPKFYIARVLEVKLIA